MLVAVKLPTGWMRLARTALAISALLLLAERSIGADPPAGVSLELIPGEIQFPLDGTEVRVTAVLHNATAEGMGKATIRKSEVPGLTIEPENDKPLAVLPNADATFVLKVARTPGAVLPTKANLIADFERLPLDGKATPKIATAQLGLTRPDIETAENPVTVEVLTDLEKLHSGDSGSLDVVVANTSQVAIKVTVQVEWPNPKIGRAHV